jgi:hypothetical protein
MSTIPRPVNSLCMDKIAMAIAASLLKAKNMMHEKVKAVQCDQSRSERKRPI